jgi:hypothetical protein
MINYKFFERSPKLFNDIFGVNLHEFEALVPEIECEFNKRTTSKYKRPGRFSRLAIRSRVMVPLICTQALRYSEVYGGTVWS